MQNISIEGLLGKERYTFNDLLAIVYKLRMPGGCPWDREQTHESLRQNLIEETYEVLDALEQEDDAKFSEELGDLLLQTVIHAQIASERGGFDMLDVTTGICKKLILRHPHIFGSVVADTSKEVKKNWEAIKKVEKGHGTHTEILQDVPHGFPALMRAYKVQKKAANAGFDWDSLEPCMDKVQEEFSEFKEALSLGKDRAADELGDLLFSIVNVARKLDIEPELALKGTIDKFIGRFAYMEREAINSGKALDDMSLDEMDELWELAKHI